MRAVKRFSWSKTELVANIAADAYENITLEIEEDLCYNEKKAETGVNTMLVFIAHMTQKTPPEQP